MLTINKVILCGRVTEDGCRLTYTAEATPHGSFTLLLEEANKQGHIYKLYISVDLFGDKAEEARQRYVYRDQPQFEHTDEWVRSKGTA